MCLPLPLPPEHCRVDGERRWWWCHRQKWSYGQVTGSHSRQRFLNVHTAQNALLASSDGVAGLLRATRCCQWSPHWCRQQPGLLIWLALNLAIRQKFEHESWENLSLLKLGNKFKNQTHRSALSTRSPNARHPSSQSPYRRTRPHWRIHLRTRRPRHRAIARRPTRTKMRDLVEWLKFVEAEGPFQSSTRSLSSAAKGVVWRELSGDAAMTTTRAATGSGNAAAGSRAAAAAADDPHSGTEKYMI